jgi:hypothetical protein
VNLFLDPFGRPMPGRGGIHLGLAGFGATASLIIQVSTKIVWRSSYKPSTWDPPHKTGHGRAGRHLAGIPLSRYGRRGRLTHHDLRLRHQAKMISDGLVRVASHQFQHALNLPVEPLVPLPPRREWIAAYQHHRPFQSVGRTVASLGIDCIFRPAPVEPPQPRL